jgi:hypothetical protein
MELSPPALWELWESRSVFCEGFSKQLVEIIKKKSPKATFVDFHSCGSFHSAFRLARRVPKNCKMIPCLGSPERSIVVYRRF